MWSGLALRLRAIGRAPGLVDMGICHSSVGRVAVKHLLSELNTNLVLVRASGRCINLFKCMWCGCCRVDPVVSQAYPGMHYSCHWGEVVDICSRWLKRGASNLAETIPPTNLWLFFSFTMSVYGGYHLPSSHYLLIPSVSGYLFFQF